MKIALITGASAGLGREFAVQLAKSGYADEIWAVARREDRLRELQKSCPVPVVPLALDLTEEKAVSVIRNRLKQADCEISYLVCAAGLGRSGTAEEVSEADNGRMVDLNVRALTDVTTACLPYLKKGSHIVELASVAGYHPMPGFAVYAASKAYVLSYSLALHQELKKRGIAVTCVCPYWVKDTEFISAAVTEKSTRFRTQPFASTADEVVKEALKDAKRCRRISAPGPVSKIDRAAAKILPSDLVVSVLDWMGKK